VSKLLSAEFGEEKLEFPWRNTKKVCKKIRFEFCCKELEHATEKIEELKKEW